MSHDAEREASEVKKICPRCKERERYVSRNGELYAYCIQCKRDYSRELSARKRAGIQISDDSNLLALPEFKKLAGLGLRKVACKACGVKPRYQFPSGKVESYCLECYNKFYRDKRKEKRLAKQSAEQSSTRKTKQPAEQLSKQKEKLSQEKALKQSSKQSQKQEVKQSQKQASKQKEAKQLVKERLSKARYKKRIRLIAEAHRRAVNRMIFREILAERIVNNGGVV